MCTCSCNAHVYLCVSPNAATRVHAGFNNRLAVARQHPVITVTVDWGGAGRSYISELHFPPVQQTAHFLKTRLSSNTLHSHLLLFHSVHIYLSSPDCLFVFIIISLPVISLLFFNEMLHYITVHVLSCLLFLPNCLSAQYIWTYCFLPFLKSNSYLIVKDCQLKQLLLTL